MNRKAIRSPKNGLRFSVTKDPRWGGEEPFPDNGSIWCRLLGRGWLVGWRHGVVAGVFLQGSVQIGPSQFFEGKKKEAANLSLGGGFKYVFIFIPTWGNDPI